MEGIVWPLLLAGLAGGIFAAVRYFQRELAKLHALSVKGDEFHAALPRKGR